MTMTTEDSKLIIFLLAPFRRIFDESIKGKMSYPPKHFNMIIDSVLASQFMRHCTISDQSFFEVVEYIYNTNIPHIRNFNFSRESILESHPYYNVESLTDDFIKDYKRLSTDPAFAKTLIRGTIIGMINESNDIDASYKNYFAGKGKMKVAGGMFINCFVHPLHLVDKDYIGFTYDEEIKDFTNDVYFSLNDKIIKFINGLMQNNQ